MVEACRKAHQRMAEGLARRKASFKEIRNQTENNVNHRFGTFLRRRRMKGAIRMDYDGKNLHMEVRPWAAGRHCLHPAACVVLC